MNITVSRNGKTEFAYNQDPNDDWNVIYHEKTDVKALRKDNKSQILFTLYVHCGVPRTKYINAKVLEWIDGKYQFTFDHKKITDLNLVDINHDGNLELIVDTGEAGYWNIIPDINIYAFDPHLNQYTIQNDKFSGYFENAINSHEQVINKETDSSRLGSSDDVEFELHVILDAWKKLNNSTKVQETLNRLSFAYLNLGKNRYREGDSGKWRHHESEYGTAIDLFSEAIKYKPDNYTAYGLRGYSYLRSKNVSLAIKSLEKSVEINPQYIEGHYNLALAYWEIKDKKKAMAEVKKVIELDPTYKAKIKDDTQFHPFNSSPWFNKLIYTN